MSEDLLHGRAVIATALHKVMEKCSYVQKTKENTFHKYKYAGEGDLLAVLRPAMVEQGLMLLPSGETFTEVDQHGNIHVAVDYTLVHKDGHIWPHKMRAFGAGNDKNKNGVGDKGLYKALTGANKYLLFKLFQIETGDDPEEDVMHERDVREERRNPPPAPTGPSEDVVEALIAKINEFDENLKMKAWWDEAKKPGGSLEAAGFGFKTDHPGAAAYQRLVVAIGKRVEENKARVAREIRDQDPALAALDDKPKESVEERRVKQLVQDDVPF